jgi:hypothetical protein
MVTSQNKIPLGAGGFPKHTNLNSATISTTLLPLPLYNPIQDINQTMGINPDLQPKLTDVIIEDIKTNFVPTNTTSTNITNELETTTKTKSNNIYFIVIGIVLFIILNKK